LPPPAAPRPYIEGFIRRDEKAGLSFRNTRYLFGFCFSSSRQCSAAIAICPGNRRSPTYRKREIPGQDREWREELSPPTSLHQSVLNLVVPTRHRDDIPHLPPLLCISYLLQEGSLLCRYIARSLPPVYYQEQMK